MKKSILIMFLLAAMAIPQVVSASWWNPSSWFDGWTFRKKEATPQIQIETKKSPDEQISELQKKIDDIKNKQSNSTSIKETATKSIQKTTTVNNKFNEISLATLKRVKKTITLHIDYTEEQITYLEEDIKYLTERKGIVKNFNDNNDPRYDYLVRADEEALKIYQKYMSNFKNYLDAMKNNLSINQQDTDAMSKHFYKNEADGAKDFLLIFEGPTHNNEIELGKELVKTVENFEKFKEEYLSFYKETLSNIGRDIEASRPVISPFVPTQAYVPQAVKLPTFTHCSYQSYGGGQAGMTCYDSPF